MFGRQFKPVSISILSHENEAGGVCHDLGGKIPVSNPSYNEVVFVIGKTESVYVIKLVYVCELVPKLSVTVRLTS